MPSTTIPSTLDESTPLALPPALLNGEYSGTATLVAGTIVITGLSWIKAAAKPVISMSVPNTTTLTTAGYRVSAVVAGVGFTITALVAAGTINVADISTLFWTVPNALE